MSFDFFTSEKLLEYLTPKGLERALQIANLQDILMALDISNVEYISDTLIKSIFMRDFELLRRLIDNIFVCCKYREFYVGQYAFLLYVLDQTIQNGTRVQSSVKLGFQSRESVDRSIFTFRYLLANDNKISAFMTKKGVNDKETNESITSRRRSIIISEGTSQARLNHDESQIFTMIKLENDDKDDEKKGEADDEFEAFYDDFIMKSDVILKEFRSRVFVINQSVAKQPWRLFAIYKSFDFFNEDRYYIHILDFFKNSPAFDIDQMTVFAFFAPQLKRRSRKLYDDLYESMKNKHRHSRLPYSFSDFFMRFESNDKNGWEGHREVVENCGFRAGTPQFAVRHDDVNFFIEKRKREKEMDAKIASGDNDAIREMMKEGGDIFIDYNMRVKENVFFRYRQLAFRCTLLQLAAYYGSEKCFNFLLENGADPNEVDDIGLSVMHFAVVGGSHPIIKQLHKLGFTFDTGSISLVAESYRLDLFEWLLSVIEINFEESYLQTGTIIHRAASANNILILLYCISRGVNVNIYDHLNLTPLFYAATNRSIDAIDLFLSHKDIEWSLSDKFKDTPLHGAAKSGDCDTFIALLKHKDADINILDFNEKTVFRYAIGEGNYDIVRLIIDKYKNEFHFNEVDNEHKIVVFDALFTNYLSAFIVACECEIIDLNVPRNDGYYLIHAIVITNQTDLARILMKQERLDPNVRLSDGTTTLHIAAKNNFLEIVDFLINNKKTDVNVVDDLGMTPIHYAIKKINYEIVKTLIKCDRIDRNVKIILITFFFFHIHNGILYILFFI